ncbi:MAG: (deoxy)nucleoside triphosphate pyrophosphohydrolase [Desulfuromonadales bacterium]|nr:(deoxy)nucleoside triphosphate pyrophosphohydrolase [Desulfuromonadales bacterium]
MGVETRRHHHVACALIEKDGLLLAAQRSAVMSLPLKWEFPGGKIEVGESPEECLHRELQEEMAVSVVIGQALLPRTHHYPDFTVTLYPFVCQLATTEIVLREHAAMRWLAPAEIMTLDWAAADLPVIADYLASAS